MPEVSMGVHINPDSIKAIVLDPQTLETKYETTHALPPSGKPSKDYDRMIDAVTEVVAQGQAQVGPVSTIGIAVSGIVHPSTYDVKSNLIPCLNGRPFHEDLSAQLHAQLNSPATLHIINDANVAAWYEVAHGVCASKDGQGLYETVVGLVVDCGLGAGIITKGQINYGKDGAFGEVGQIPMFPFEEYNDMICLSNQRATQTTNRYLIVGDILSSRGLSRLNEIHRGAPCTVSTFKHELEAQNKAARQVFDRFTSIAADAIATFVFANNPDAFIVSGAVSELPGFTQKVSRNLALMAQRDERFHVPVLSSKSGSSAPARGAALLPPSHLGL